METFKQDLEGIFENVGESLMFYIQEYGLDLDEASEAFCEYAKQWFQQTAKDLSEE